ncbi:MAG TPA: DUF2007 domain-containing protein [Nitrospiraceae bacterium]|jgi:hypothetical protein|nr:DUF2007 domain-containing protein [Nitrospiraceae bacterium]
MLFRSSGSRSGRFVTVREPGDAGELAVVKSLLEGNGIAYVVQHEHVGALYPGVPFLSSRVMVAESEKDRAETLLSRLNLQIREMSGETE